MSIHPIYLAILSFFNERLNINWTPDEDAIKLMIEIAKRCDDRSDKKLTRSRMFLILSEAINQKFDLNKKNASEIFTQCGISGVRLHYYDKIEIINALNSQDKRTFNSIISKNIDKKQLRGKVISLFDPINAEHSVKHLKKYIDKHEDCFDVISAVFSRFFYNCFPEDLLDEFFGAKYDNLKTDYSYLDHVYKLYPDLKSRSPGLCLFSFSKSDFSNGYEDGCDKIFSMIKESFELLSNHSYLCVHIPQIKLNGIDVQWKLYSDVVLFAEKFNQEKIDKMYFRWEKICHETKKHIPHLDVKKASFELASQGYAYKDCFCIKIDESDSEYDLLITLEKNVRDERPMPCPACHSMHIEGNSYPVLNVRSWECQNPICPERSKYNRGNRYSFYSLFRQESNKNPDDYIPFEKIKKWMLDCLSVKSFDSVFEMAITFYSLSRDEVFVYGLKNIDHIYYGRKIIHYSPSRISNKIFSNFKKSSFFQRYLINNNSSNKDKSCVVNEGIAKIQCGDSLVVLKQYDSCSIDGAVTSPPYYNAKSYSNWPNIYCYLYDMYNIAQEVYRVLKFGAVYLFNIFDYFDNENSVVFSAMGKKRMILGAYIIDMFERIGYKLNGNMVWNKDQIQGKRHFNQGNDIPYYQAPLNCWEHILIFSKGRINKKYEFSSKIVDIRPVIKMVRGKNILGHDAPFPEEIPNILIKQMDSNEIILDPFCGSLTTGITAFRQNIQSINIDYNLEYCKLGLQRLNGQASATGGTVK